MIAHELTKSLRSISRQGYDHLWQYGLGEFFVETDTLHDWGYRDNGVRPPHPQEWREDINIDLSAWRRTHLDRLMAVQVAMELGETEKD